MYASQFSFLISGVLMMVVSAVALGWCRHWTRARIRWFWIGAGLWTVAVALKAADSLIIMRAALPYLEKHLPHAAYVSLGSFYVGAESAFYEMGLTLLAVLIWRKWGRYGAPAIAVGIGAGVFEALLLGFAATVAVILVVLGLGGSALRESMGMTAKVNPILLLAAPIERISAILVHGATRALILTGITHRRYWHVFLGIAIFTYIDTVAGFAHLSGFMIKHSVWWVELMLAPAAVISIPCIRACWRWYGAEPATDSAAGAAMDAGNG